MRPPLSTIRSPVASRPQPWARARLHSCLGRTPRQVRWPRSPRATRECVPISSPSCCPCWPRSCSADCRSRSTRRASAPSSDKSPAAAVWRPILGQLAGAAARRPRARSRPAAISPKPSRRRPRRLARRDSGGAARRRRRPPRPRGRPGAPAPSGLPGGLDPAAIQSAIEMIKKTLAQGGPAPGGAASAPAGGRHAELQDVLDRVFPRG